MDFLYFLSSLRNDLLDIFFTVCTAFGEELILIGLFAVVYLCVNKKLAYKLAFTYFISGIAVQWLKLFMRVPRPWVLDPDFKPVTSALKTATGYSFPSGHTQSSTALFATLAFHFKKISIAIPCLAVTGLVMLSRMYLGCHTPADVLTAFAVTMAVAFATNYIFENFNSTSTTDFIVLLFTLLASIGLMAYSYYIVDKGITEEALAMDGFKAAGAGIGFGIGWYIEKRYIKFNPQIGSLPMQAVKLIVGVLIAFAIKSGLKLVPGNEIAMSVIRYFLTVLWIAAAYPAIIKRCYSRQ